MNSADLIIIGGGPAGISAATEAARRQLSVVLIDENMSLGGKVFRQEEVGLGKASADPFEAGLRKGLFDSFESVRDRIQVLLGAEVWNIEGDRKVHVYSAQDQEVHPQVFRGQKVIIASGAIERVVPFEGWTAPGVFTIGGLNALAKKGVVPGKQVLIAGSGPLPLVLIKNLVQAKANIRAVVVPISLRTMIRNTLPVLRNAGWHRVKQAMDAAWRVRTNHIPVINAHVLKQVRGGHNDFTAVISRIGPDWRPITGSEEEIRADVIAVGYGLMPSVELTRLAGCEHTFDHSRGYWRVVRGDGLETSIPGIFVAGDGVQVKGYEAAIAEGQLAAIEAARQLGKTTQHDADRCMVPITKRLKRMEAFGWILDRLSVPEPGILANVPDQTLICRCEEVTLGDIRKAVDDGAASINDVKRRTRLGMGHCQGRFCGQVINDLLGILRSEKAPVESFTPRIPVRPVPFKVLAG
jgi:thioredoxin reductase/bacterioferritin-associated ferredoxin